MRKTILPIAFAAALAVSFTVSPVEKADSKKAITHTIVNNSSAAASTTVATAEATALSIYERLELDKLGLSVDAMKYAYKGYEQLREKGALANSDVLTVVDFSQSSRKKRMYIIDLKNDKVLFNTYVAHGKNSGLDYANQFSNTPESLQSSLGFYVTKGTYSGKHGLSLRLSGQEKGWNDNAEERAVVVHGANYIGDHRVSSAYMGRSFGCPAVPQEYAEKVINLLKDGTCLFIYHPSSRYEQESTLLNG
ncbi:murein L,D-transpeptidase catalytic domain family protein [Flavisolibacter tropicus]|uniref:murein L,D-transpeptidase catalytic domain family protein n=1 Tax=Flavisolibacter tropicus TaxID=1492898 RepID=UPI0009EE55D4|nr:murein L,D-transpeptidase catalytic domain family protein [Flavisolibacter tropicus]